VIARPIATATGSEHSIPALAACNCASRSCARAATSRLPWSPESEKALVAVIQEAWVGGVSTRRVEGGGAAVVVMARETVYAAGLLVDTRTRRRARCHASTAEACRGAIQPQDGERRSGVQLFSFCLFGNLLVGTRRGVAWGR
jgi:hypothetical protein